MATCVTDAGNRRAELSMVSADSNLRRVTAARTGSTDCAAAVISGSKPYRQEFQYDRTGNRLKATTKGLNGAADQVCTSAYPAPGDGVDRPHAVMSVTSGAETRAYQYDPVGNLVSRPDASGTPTTVDLGRRGAAGFDRVANRQHLLRVRHGRGFVGGSGNRSPA